MQRKRGREDDEPTDGYAWEGDIERPWESIEEDERGHLKTNKALYQRRLHDDSNAHRLVRRGVIRYLFVILDLSTGSLQKDVAPSRHTLMLEVVYDFLHSFFDQNPLSQVGLVVMRDSVAEMAVPFTSDCGALQGAVEELYLNQGSGSPSIENALCRVAPTFGDVPGYASREVLLLFNALHTCDPNSVIAAISNCISHRIQCSAVGIRAEMFVLKRLARETHGTYTVALNEQHYRDLVLAHLTPPPSPPLTGTEESAEMILMGFPSRKRGAATFCFCHRKERRMTSEGFFCPRCQAKYCNLPTVCAICSLTLVSSPHLARSYHHLFPLESFEQVVSVDFCDFCFGCQKPIDASADVALKCPKCQKVFCMDCDHFIHKSLHNCPGCLD
eukprot:GGOE01036738.1.p1 GENE.GGOE01036738.1~~GGOE01036738.1.p1  ORF type:complete len:387 (-),score=75.01 GGOE01036738.1:31-1191(-)